MIGKIIVIIAVLAIAGGVIPNQAFASGAYQRGYADAACDSNDCHGHGYDPSCPSEHSSDYCSNYESGYYEGWNNNGDVRSVSSQSEGAAIGGNKVNGDNNIINQQIVQSQRHNSDNNANSENNDHNDGGDNSGQLPKCKAFCLGVQ
jgi:hypothetical protein